MCEKFTLLDEINFSNKHYYTDQVMVSTRHHAESAVQIIQPPCENSTRQYTELGVTNIRHYAALQKGIQRHQSEWNELWRLYVIIRNQLETVYLTTRNKLWRLYVIMRLQ